MSSPKSPTLGRPVCPRRIAYCYECHEDTIQWLTHIYPYSPGSYRGIRIDEIYRCTDCGAVVT